jgi:outer membrane protein assembly factor BamB
VGCGDGAVYGLNLSDGKQIWKFTAGSRIASSPAFGEKGTRMVIGADDGAVYCFGR